MQDGKADSGTTGVVSARAGSRVLLAFLCVLGMVYLVLIWSGQVGLRNGDFAARLVVGRQVSFSASYFLQDLWRFIWPPLPFVFDGVVHSVCRLVGLSHAEFVQVRLSLSAGAGLLTLWLASRVGAHFTSPRGAIAIVLCVAAVPFFHVVFLSVLSQTLATPLMLLGLLLFIRAVDARSSVLAPGFVFLLVSLARSDSVVYSGLLSFALLAQRRVLGFILFNAVSGAFFLAHQTALAFTGSYSYLNVSRHDDFSAVTMGDRITRGLRECSALLQIPSGTQALIGLLLFLGFALLGWAALWRWGHPERRRSSLLLLVYPLGGILLFALPFVLGGVYTRHARDAVYALVLLGTCMGSGLSALYYRQRRREGGPGVVTTQTCVAEVPGQVRGRSASRAWWIGVLAVLVLLSARAVWTSLDERRPPDETRSVLAWLHENAAPGDRIVFEAPWSEYLHANTLDLPAQGSHWSFAKVFYALETRKDPVLERIGLTTLDGRTLCTWSAAYFLETQMPRFIVCRAIRPEQAKHLLRLREGYLLSRMTEIDGRHRNLFVPDVMAKGVRLVKRFANPQYHVWEIVSGREGTRP